MILILYFYHLSRLIRNTNGLTTIQLLQHHHQESLAQNSLSPSPSPTSLSPPFHHLHLSKQEVKREHSDEDMMPTDLRKSYA